MEQHPIVEILEKRKGGESVGVYSVCSANRFVIEAAMERARETGTRALIEATANQVNQFGGYTGMQPADFAAFVYDIAEKTGLPRQSLILGGDHLGPLTWQNEREGPAMEKSEELVRAYVSAGFTKIHIDTSMMLADDDRAEKLSDAAIARRAARLAKVSEEAYASLRAQGVQRAQGAQGAQGVQRAQGVQGVQGAQGLQEAPGSQGLQGAHGAHGGEAPAPVYVIGSEVPVPGGAQENDESISVTTAEQFEQTREAFEREFSALGLTDAMERIIAVVVQPGVEFSDETVTPYNRERAKKLCACLEKRPGLVFEGHSTDYQTRACLRQMVEDGIAILKVGPALTYALRQALFALNDIENELLAGKGIALSGFRDVLEEAMLSNPLYWEKYYHDDAHSSASFKRKYSFSDRCRYYLPEKKVAGAIETLMANIDGAHVPVSVLEQYMPLQYTHVREGRLSMDATAIIKDRVKDFIDDYLFAVT